MTDDFQRGLITGLAMQPLQVTTEHAAPDEVTAAPSEFVRGFVRVAGMINLFHVVGDDVE